MDEYEILLVWDDESARWIAENDDIPIALESDSLDALIERVRIAVPELLELNGKNHDNVALNFKMERQTVMV
jgi:EAL domain-containing protein (putative c-di-GMP-specific phosphodiesterase class I)